MLSVKIRCEKVLHEVVYVIHEYTGKQRPNTNRCETPENAQKGIEVIPGSGHENICLLSSHEGIYIASENPKH
jgi:hypothetical protein